MKTRSRKPSPNTSNNRRKPLSDQTNNVTVSDNMKRKNNSKVTPVNTRQTRKNSLDTSRRISDRLKGVSPKKTITKTTKSTKVKSGIKIGAKTLQNKNTTKSEVKSGKNSSENKNKNVELNSSLIKKDTGQNLKETRNTRSKSLNKNETNSKLVQEKTDSKENHKPVINEHLNETKLDVLIKSKSVEKLTKNRSLRSNSINTTNDNNKSEISGEKTVRKSPQKNITNKTTDEINPELNVSLTKETEELKNPKNKRLLGSFKFTSPENNSDPYEFKIDSKEELKRKPKKRRPKKHDGTLDTSDDEDKSFKPISKNTKKKQQQIHVTPVERKLRNRHIKVVRKTPQSIKVPEKRVKKVPEKVPNLTRQPLPQTYPKTPEIIPQTCPKIPEIIPQTCPKITEIIPQTCPKTSEIIPQTCPKTPNRNMSVVDEINEIANTFLEDEEEEVSISTPSRIDIISNLIVRKSYQPSTQVFNSTMIHETPQNVEPRSPWRVEVSAIARKPLNFSVKNKSLTPSYVPEFVIPTEKKQTTLLGFVNRQPKADLPITLFDNNSKSPRKPFGDLSNSMSPIRQINSPQKSDDSLFGFTVLTDSENKENTPVKRKSKSPPKSKLKLKKPSPKVLTENTNENNINVQENEVDKNIDISFDCIPLFEDLNDNSRNEKRYSRQYTRPHIKRKRNVSFKIDSDVEDSDSDTEIHVKKKQKDVLSKEEADEAERLASHYNSYFEEIENYPLCIE